MKITSIMNRIITLLLLASYSCLWAQTTFTVSPSSHSLNTVASQLVVYNYSELTNNTDGELQLRWVKIMGPGFPSDWTTTVQDPQTFWNDNAIDSAEFVLGVEASFLDKIILQFYPNGQPGFGTAQLKIYNINEPEDVAYISYSVNVAGDPTGIVIDTQPAYTLNFYPNPVRDMLTISQTPYLKQLTMVDISGKVVWTSNGAVLPKSFDVSFLKPGIYLLRGKALNSKTLYLGRFIKH